MLNKLVIYFCVFFFFSCQKNNTIRSAKYQINFANSTSSLGNEKLVEISEIAEIPKIIKLETTNECLIGRVHKMKIYKDKIFILDISKSKGLFEFDMQGKFIRKYGKVGKGPGEYLVPFSFDIDRENNEIIIYDRSTASLVFYDFDGGYKGSIDIKIKANDFIVNGKDRYVFDTFLVKKRTQQKQQFTFTLTDSDGKVIDDFLETNKLINKLNFINKGNIFVNSSEGTVLLNTPFTNTIYQFDNEKIIPLFEFNFGNKKIPSELTHNISYRELMNKLSASNYKYLDANEGYFFVNSKFLFTIRKGSERVDCVFNSKSNEIYRINPKNTSVNLGLFGIKMGIYKNEVISYAESSWLLRSESFKDKKFEGTKILEIVENTKETDNPIIFLTTLN